MGRPVPESVRHIVRATHHAARAVECPHCGAAAHQPCTTRSKRRRLTVEVHPGRITSWVVSIACCPACQVAPGTPCHSAGRPLYGGAVHAERTTEAKRTAA
ncbi:MAG: hypothetical protein JO362_06045 [Streptomycetaceae bacterium]|nr:hypothetical protein [Streptomycetaceae bacterium]